MDGQEVLPGYGRSRGFDLADVRRERQVSLLHGEHQLWTKHELARDELARSSGAPCDLPRGVECERVVATLAGDWRRAEAPEPGRAQARSETGSTYRSQRDQSKSARGEHSARRLRQSHGRRGWHFLLYRTNSRRRAGCAAPATLSIARAHGDAVSRGQHSFLLSFRRQ